MNLSLHPAVHRELFTDLPPNTRVPIPRSRQIDLVRLAKKVQRSGASPGGGSGARQRASSGAGASTSSARPEPQGRPDTSTPKQRELVTRVNRAKLAASLAWAGAA